MSSVFSLNIIISTLAGSLTGLGTPLNQRIGRTHANKSKRCLNVTLRLLKPPPTGVVNGPFIATKCSLIEANVPSGNHSPVCLNAFSPARICFQEIFLSLPYAFRTAASNTLIATGVTSWPMPSPIITGIMGLLGTSRFPPL